MASSTSLQDRIDAEFAAADARIKQFKGAQLEAHQGRQQRLEKLHQTFDELRSIWQPRLEALAQKFGERVAVQPQVEKGKRSAAFEFKSELARIKLRFGVAPDADVRNLTFTYDLEIIPILMKFDSHDEIEFPLEKIDKHALGKWFDDRIIGFVKTYLALHENQYYLKDHMVEDPVAKVRFPKYAAGATAEIGGKTYYFVDEATCREFQKKK
jgi:YHS domain-containing protein